MPGMGGPLSSDNPVIVAAFHAALRHQVLIVLVLLTLAVAAQLGTMQARAATRHRIDKTGGTSEHPGRRLLRVSFGLLWILDGLLQVQQAMPLGLPNQVIGPSASGSPEWVRHVIQFGLHIWTRHPIPAATSVVWIQIGIGALLILAPRGRLSRAAGVISIGWGLVVWVFGEAFGGIFAPGVTFLFGAPGAALFYCAAGLLIALPDRVWVGRRLGRTILGTLGLFLVGMAVLQAWPDRGFWQEHGGPHAPAGALTTMVRGMSSTPQPAWLSGLNSSFATFDANHGWAVNLFFVVSLAAIGLMLLSGRRRLSSVAVVYGTAMWLFVWVVIQDLGFLGGVGTDPNSMIPAVLVLLAGWLALTREPAVSQATIPATPGPLAGEPAPGNTGDQPAPARPLAIPVRSIGSATAFGALTALATLGILLVGAVPMAFASLNPRTDAVVTEAVNGQPEATNSPAPAFHLTDRHGATVSLGTLRGRTIALTFLDPVCTSDCPLIAQEFRQVDSRLGIAAGEGMAALRDPGRDPRGWSHGRPQRPGLRHRPAREAPRGPWHRPRNR